jgi:polysaccharide export outer membrane protein
MNTRISAKVFIAKMFVVYLTSLLIACSSVPTTNKDSSRQTSSYVGKEKMADEKWFVPEASALPLSPGDRVRVKVEDGETFGGIFEVNIDGCLHIPYINAVRVIGLSVKEAEEKLKQALIDEKMFQPSFNGVSMTILQWSKIHIFVTGSVFRPGRVLINDQFVAEQAFQQTQQSGDFSVNRYLTAGLKGAGGIRPDADLSRIRVTRNGKITEIDIRGIFTGAVIKDIPLISGDEIFIPSVGYVQEGLMRPSQITPPGFQIFISNLSIPNSASLSGQKMARDLPYGSRLFEGAMAANCVGGSWINSSRKILYSSKNSMTGKTSVKIYEMDDIATSVEDQNKNPYMMPDDGIACFDSTATNAREIAKFLGDIIDPAAIAKLLLLL